MTSRCEHRFPCAAGFTLVELLVCLAIMGALLVLVPSMLSGSHSGVRLRGAAHDVAAALRETRSSAIGNGAAVAFSVDVAHGSWRAGAGAIHRLPSDITAALVTTEAERQGKDRGTIRFFADGSSTGGGVRLARGDRTLTILVDWLTGRVSLAEGAP